MEAKGWVIDTVERGQGGEGLGGKGKMVDEGVVDCGEVINVSVAPFIALPGVEHHLNGGRVTGRRGEGGGRGLGKQIDDLRGKWREVLPMVDHESPERLLRGCGGRGQGGEEGELLL